MIRRLYALLAIVAMMMVATASMGQGQGNAPERGNTTETLGFHENAEEVEVHEVRPEVGDPTRTNFDDQFIYYRVTYEEITYETHLYREVSRFEGNFEFGAGTSDRFWYGVTGPDDDGVQHEVVHDGLAVQYFRVVDEDDSKVWKHLTANFAKNDFGHGLLTDINGAGPEGVFGDVEWSPTAGPNVGHDIRSTFSTAQDRVVTTNRTAETVRSINLTCDRMDGDEAFLYGHDGDDPVIVYIRGGDSPAFNQWTNPTVTTDPGGTCHSWSGDSQFNGGFIEFGQLDE